MRLILFKTELDKNEFMRSFAALPKRCYRKIQVTDGSDYDSFIADLGESPPSCIVTATDGKNVVISANSACKSV